VALPYGEELLRCLRAGRAKKQRKQRAGADAARWQAV
jgi:hypothetical protein